MIEPRQPGQLRFRQGVVGPVARRWGRDEAQAARDAPRVRDQALARELADQLVDALAGHAEFGRHFVQARRAAPVGKITLDETQRLQLAAAHRRGQARLVRARLKGLAHACDRSASA